MPIKNLPLHLRPREKALMLGIENLSDIELLALCLRNGLKDYDALQIAKDIFSFYSSFSQLSYATLEDLKRIKGIGKVKAIEMASVFEIAKRMHFSSQHVPQNYFKDWKVAAIYAQNTISNFNQESFLLLILDNNFNLKFQKILFQGQTDIVQVEPKIIISHVLKYESKKFYCFHNHPSEDFRPSNDDKLFTKRLNYYCDLFDLEILGHIVVSKRGYSLIKG